MQLADTAAVYRHVAERLRAARSYVYDLSWGPSITQLLSHEESAAFEVYMANKAATIERGIVYQEVWTFPDDARKERIRRMLELNRANYRARYYELDHVSAPPLLNFVVLDDEVILAFYSGRDLRGNPDVHLATGNKLMHDLFEGYFNAIWSQANGVDESAIGQRDTV